MPDRDPTPRRFRRRLTAAFVVVAAISAGLVAAVTVLLARESRWRGFRANVLEETRFALALAPSTLTEDDFERFRAVYERRSDANILAVDGTTWYGSSVDLTPEDIPADLGEPGSEPTLVEAEVDGRPVVVAGATDRNGVRYYLFFSLDQLRQGVAELTRAAAISWIGTTMLAGAVGAIVARRTLRPVADVASAAEAIASGDLSTRLPTGVTDEFGSLAASFNHMADEVEAHITRLAEAAARERRFTANVAHELRTPLTGMSAAAALIRPHLQQLPPSSQRAATILVHDVERLRGLVLELLELATLDALPGAETSWPLDLRAAIEAVTEKCGDEIGPPIAVSVEPDLQVLANPVQLRRILTNLLDNAATHGAGADVRIHGYRCGDEVCIDVIDDGPGITPADIGRVFDRFFKSDTSRATGGAGLGLAIAREYTQRQGGSLSVSSIIDHGTRFTVRLPNAEP